MLVVDVVTLGVVPPRRGNAVSVLMRGICAEVSLPILSDPELIPSTPLRNSVVDVFGWYRCSLVDTGFMLARGQGTLT